MISSSFQQMMRKILDLYPEALGVECSLRRESSWLEGITGCWPEKTPSSAFELI